VFWWLLLSLIDLIPGDEWKTDCDESVDTESNRHFVFIDFDI